MEDPSADSGGGGDGGAATEGPAVQVADIRWPTGGLPLRLLEWKVKPGSLINVDSVLALCVPIAQGKGAENARLPEKRVKSDRAGVVKELCCQLGQVIPPGGVIVKIEECSHPVVMKGLCAECGQDLTQLQSSNRNKHAPISTATVSMVHSVPELMVSSEQAEQLGREDQHRLHRNKKLVLMVDLDQTLIHTTEQHCQRMSNKGIFHFQLGRGEPMLHTRLRPHCKAFLEKIAKLFELHVFTFGSRLYAHTIAGFLDPEKKLFSHRILSRDECIDPFSKTGNLRNLFPCGDSMVCIIDDREDVWKFAPNLITVKKYIYFQGTGDINAPPGSREAQMTKKAGGPSVRSAESTETAGTTAGAEEHNNGLRKKAKDNNISGKDESSISLSSQKEPANEWTHASKGVEEESGQIKHSVNEALPEAGLGVTQEPDRTATEAANKKLQEEQEVTNSSSVRQDSNNLDFDLSSDSDSESFTEKPASSESDHENISCKEKTPGSEGDIHQSVDGEEAKVADIKENNSDITESSDVLLPDPELGNGCSDRREPETESQNSELSGVTMGEELLDQSMEDDDDEEDESDIDQDDHLIYLEEVLERIHAEYFARYEAYLRKEAPEIPDIRRIVPELKGKTLQDTMIVFSGLYPTNYPIERTREFYHTKALGAKISKKLVLNSQDPNCTTHLIAARAGTEKVRQAQGCKHLHVVNPDWLWSCLERWERVEEQLYPLKEDYSNTPRSNSPSAFPDNQGSLLKTVFQPLPIHQKPQPPAPEVRTYDPVTGKLIRRGPQVSRPSSYLQTSASLLLSDHSDQSCLRGNSNSLQEDAGEINQDNEQPGPSRRKRQPSMSETMPLYTLCKEDLESMDKEGL
ncbi:RNA polymerase II subunit A C-terminal domain phosphatase isoform X2 [Cynoglossus semilaevis]|uniref:RNA polymerase II subunit A C-terminal domain phosphatase isoform X2 n=1 Tax=Cynoglossus semilaevis TaxID=244447 RepID=UPI000D6295DE|nr:RNA polymerase II subunit A C-terminal domain phosphatase isoform X2 [Cynoglossus semilaevis]